MNKKIIATAFIAILVLLSYGIPRDQKIALIIDPINDASDFTQKATALLTENGYKITIISGENVTVQLMKNLPPDHDIYILRVHSTCINNRTWIFTGETYDTQKYPLMQLADLIHRARPSLDSGYYFAVSPELIAQYNQDSFKGGTILMMGCEGLSYNDMAMAFCDEGASNYVSWSGNVCLEHTDQAFLALIETHYSEKTPLNDSITHVASAIGADPVYHSVLRAYKTSP